MDHNTLSAITLGVSAPWQVVRSGLEVGGAEIKFLYAEIEVQPGAQMPCSPCGELCPFYDHEVKRWRHLNSWQHPTYLSARLQRPQHQVKQVRVPRARPDSGFTLLFSAYVIALVREMPVAAVANLVAEHDTRLWRVVRYYVGQTHDRQDWGKVRVVAVDDTATRKGHRYATIMVELDPQQTQPARLLFMTPERTAASFGEFAAAMPAHGAKPDQMRLAAIDMSAAHHKGLREHLLKAEIVFDRFHVMQLAGRAVDEVRKQFQRGGVSLKGALWALRGNVSRLSQAQLQLRHDICARQKELGRAMALRESLQDNWQWRSATGAELHLTAWCSWVVLSRLASFKQLVQTLKRHWQGILAYCPHRITSAAIESINSIIQTARRRARGFRKFDNLKAICYWMADRLDLQTPSAFTHPA